MNTQVRKVFISHGHNMVVAYELRDFVEKKLGLSALILSEQPDEGLTVIEKLERYARTCDFALILLTADDLTVQGGRRARQNVIHELGFFHGLLGRDRVLLLKQTDVEDFSNISGLIYKAFPDSLIKSTFEDVRDVLTKGSASARGATIPKDETLADQARMAIEDICQTDYVTGWKADLLGQMKATLQGLSGGPKLKRLKAFLRDRKSHWLDGHNEQMGILKKASEDAGDDPDGVSSFAVTARIFLSASPKQMVDFIEELQQELNFCMAQKMNADTAITRIEKRFRSNRTTSTCKSRKTGTRGANKSVQ